MKKIFEMYSIYNKKVNDSLINILINVSKKELQLDLNTFYKSILDTFIHIFLSDLNWLKQVQNAYSYSSINQSEIIRLTSDKIKQKIEEDYKYVFKIRKELDDLIENLINEINENDFEKNFKFKNIRGEEIEKIFWITIIHIFNHQTHHRGEISAMLDILNIKNDYSGIRLYF